MRKNIEELSLTQLQNYNIGMGTASNQTTKQTILAQKYTQHIINKATNDVILVDASINSQEDPRTHVQRKIEQTGCGGYEGFHITKNNNKIKRYFHQTINTNDAQAAKLQGIATAMEIAKDIQNEKITI